MGGTNDPSNLIELTVEEHALAHKKLFEEHGRWQDEVAWKGLSGMIGKEEIIRLIQSQPHSEESKKKMSFTRTGKTLSEESKKKISIARTGMIFSEEHRKKISLAKMDNLAWKGKTHSEESKKKISIARTGMIFSEEHRKKISLAMKGKTHSC